METPETSPALAAKFKMIDVGEKADTRRRAIASGRFYAAPATIQRIRERSLPKGDVLTLAEVAGIMAAKRTADLLPLCHPLPLHSVKVWTECSTDHVQVWCEAITTGKTGVEMEALQGVTGALLCIYDLAKNIDPVLRIGEVVLERKEGGKSGVWLNPTLALSVKERPQENLLQSLHGIQAAVLTMSDSSAKAGAADRSGPLLCDYIKTQGAELHESRVISDSLEDIERSILDLFERSPVRLILTSGGTGLGPRDNTPQVLIKLCERFGGKEVSGIGELLRHSGSMKTSNAWLSRSSAYAIKNVLIVTLPGSPKAVNEGLDVLKPVLTHALKMIDGGGHGAVR